tara:strand:+ start:2828 stop:4432 length:1605 start_codon:yes stop_codon:yes gene_type:complete
MKNYVSKLALLFFGLSLMYSCEPGIVIENNTPSEIAYELHLEELPNKNAPALQSFVHGISGEEWLLFAGRTNQSNDNGGLHDMNGDYTDTSFPPVSYNDSIFVYNLKRDARVGISMSQLKGILTRHFPKNAVALNGFEAVFRNSNPLVKQDGDFLYVVGGFGPIDFKAKGSAAQNYMTYNHVARIHVPSLVAIVNGNYDSASKELLFSFGRDTTNTLVSTGGELEKAGGSLYVVMGHCFGNNCTPFQKYVDAAYPFSVSVDTSGTIKNIHKLNISISNAISDVSNPKGAGADNMSAFRRRDGPITPAIYKSPVNDTIQEGIAIYSGVFKAGNDNNLQAWNDAIYIHPAFANKENTVYTYDRAYNQKDFNVYAAPNFVMYDADKEITHTFLLGGIGDGQSAANGKLSGFTNTGMHIETKIVTDFKTNTVITSTNKLISQNIYLNNEKNDKPFYGAEAILFPNESLITIIVPAQGGKNGTPARTTEILDMSKFDGSEIHIGHVFGGIEAFESNPATYGPGKSRASKKIFKVVLKKK